MARYKEYDYSQGKFIPIHFDRQIIPGTFEHTLHYLIDNELDLSIFDLRYQNDKTGAPAYDPSGAPGDGQERETRCGENIYK